MKPKAITNLANSSPDMPERLRQLWHNAKAVSRPQAVAAELLLYDVIGPDYWSASGGLTAQGTKDWLGKLTAETKDITVRINSPGGDVFEGVGIYNALLTWQSADAGRKITVRIDALAASIASVIAMAGDEIVIAGNAMIMIHPASTMTWGTAADHLNSATLLEQIDETILSTYTARTEQKPEEIKAWMDAETFMTSSESVARGFADRAEELKSKPTKETEAPPAPDKQSEARLAAARLLQARSRQRSIAAHLASR